MTLEEYLDAAHFDQFCRQLISLCASDITKLVEVLGTRLTQFDIDSLHDLYTFQHLCEKIAKKHMADIFHLWTAHRNSLPYFVMIDQRFQNALKGVRGLKLHTQVVSPAELLQELGITELDPLPLAPGQSMFLHEALRES